MKSIVCALFASEDRVTFPEETEEVLAKGQLEQKRFAS
jgi:hypothetical protein